MGADAGLHADEAGREVGEPGFELAAGELLAQNDGARLLRPTRKVFLPMSMPRMATVSLEWRGMGRAPCLGQPPARRWGTAESTAGPSLRRPRPHGPVAMQQLVQRCVWHLIFWSLQ